MFWLLCVCVVILWFPTTSGWNCTVFANQFEKCKCSIYLGSKPLSWAAWALLLSILFSSIVSILPTRWPAAGVQLLWHCHRDNSHRQEQVPWMTPELLTNMCIRRLADCTSSFQTHKPPTIRGSCHCVHGYHQQTLLLFQQLTRSQLASKLMLTSLKRGGLLRKPQQVQEQKRSQF